MRRFGDLNVGAVVCALVAVAVAATMGEWPALRASGGWFAVFGQMLAVIAALAIGAMLTALALALVVLPLIGLHSLLGSWVSGPREALDAGDLARRAVRAIDPAWKAAWRLWWTWIGRHRHARR